MFVPISDTVWVNPREVVAVVARADKGTVWVHMSTRAHGAVHQFVPTDGAQLQRLVAAIGGWLGTDWVSVVHNDSATWFRPSLVTEVVCDERSPSLSIFLAVESGVRQLILAEAVWLPAGSFDARKAAERLVSWLQSGEELSLTL